MSSILPWFIIHGGYSNYYHTGWRSKNGQKLTTTHSEFDLITRPEEAFSISSSASSIFNNFWPEDIVTKLPTIHSELDFITLPEEEFSSEIGPLTFLFLFKFWYFDFFLMNLYTRILLSIISLIHLLRSIWKIIYIYIIRVNKLRILC